MRVGLCITAGGHLKISMIRLLVFNLLIASVALVEALGENTLSEEEKAAGWKLLFDGNAAPGLRGLQKSEPFKSGWQIKDGQLILPKEIKVMGKVTGGDLITVEAFLDFEFSFEWKLMVSSNTGVRYLARAGTGSGVAGCEYQIIDDVHHPEGLKGGPIRRTGALDGVIPPAAEKTLNEPGEWNRGRIVVLGNHVEHWLNGSKVVEFELGSRALAASVQAAKAKVPMGFGTKFKAPIVILDQGDEFALRNLKIRSLAAVAAVVPTARAPLAPTPPDLK